MPERLLEIIYIWKKKALLCFLMNHKRELSDKSIMELELQDFYSFTSVSFSAACLQVIFRECCQYCNSLKNILAQTQCLKIHGVFLYTKLSLTKSSNTATEEMKKYVPWKPISRSSYMGMLWYIFHTITLYIENRVFKYKNRNVWCPLITVNFCNISQLHKQLC